MTLTWTITDRANRVWFYLFLAAGVVGGAAILWVAQPALWAMVLVGLMLFQAWRLALDKTVTVTVDETGITKTIGRETWHRDWSEAGRAELREVWGTHQLVLLDADATPQEWSYSNRLSGLARIGRGALAAQVPADQVAALRKLLAARAG